MYVASALWMCNIEYFKVHTKAMYILYKTCGCEKYYMTGSIEIKCLLYRNPSIKRF